MSDTTKSKRTTGRLLIRLFEEIVAQKKWILLPVWILILALALLFFLSSGSVLLPAIYMAF